MKEYVLNRSGTSPKMDKVPDMKIPIYEDEAALEADLDNLEEGQIVATKDYKNADLISRLVQRIEALENMDWTTIQPLVVPAVDNFDTEITFTAEYDTIMYFMAYKLQSAAALSQLYIDDKLVFESKPDYLFDDRFDIFIPAGSTMKFTHDGTIGGRITYIERKPKSEMTDEQRRDV